MVVDNLIFSPVEALELYRTRTLEIQTPPCKLDMRSQKCLYCNW